MSEYRHWCGTCPIRIYIQRHYGRILTWQDCPYTCAYAESMRRFQNYRARFMEGVMPNE